MENAYRKQLRDGETPSVTASGRDSFPEGDAFGKGEKFLFYVGSCGSDLENAYRKQLRDGETPSVTASGRDSFPEGDAFGKGEKFVGLQVSFF